MQTTNKFERDMLIAIHTPSNFKFFLFLNYFGIVNLT